MILKLQLSTVLNPEERQNRLIAPMDEALGENGEVVFSLPEYFIDQTGNRRWKVTSIEIFAKNILAIDIIRKVLLNGGLEDRARLFVPVDNYNLLDLVE